MPAPQTTPTQAQDVFRPVILRGLIAAVYALLSMFWPNTEVQVLAYATAALLVLTGVFSWQYVTVPSAPGPVRAPYAVGSMAAIIAGIACIFMTTPASVGYAAAAGLALFGASEITAFVKYRAVFPPLRNQLVSGVVAVGIAAALSVAGGLDAHGMFGLIGGGAIILAVFGLIAGFGHRHEARAAASAEDDETGPGSDADDN